MQVAVSFTFDFNTSMGHNGGETESLVKEMLEMGAIDFKAVSNLEVKTVPLSQSTIAA